MSWWSGWLALPVAEWSEWNAAPTSQKRGGKPNSSSNQSFFVKMIDGCGGGGGWLAFLVCSRRGLWAAAAANAPQREKTNESKQPTQLIHSSFLSSFSSLPFSSLPSNAASWAGVWLESEDNLNYSFCGLWAQSAICRSNNKLHSFFKSCVWLLCLLFINERRKNNETNEKIKRKWKIDWREWMEWLTGS